MTEKKVQFGGKIETLIKNAKNWRHWTERKTCVDVELEIGMF